MGKIKIFIIHLIIVASLTSFVMNVQASSWYVDNAASGTNVGTSWTNAWTTFSSVIWGAGGVVAGDTLYISGGSTSKTYTETWTVGVSGTDGSPITIRPGQDANHNGVVIFDYDGLGDEATAVGISISNRKYLVFNGEYNGARHIKIQNLRNIMDRTKAYAISGANSYDDNITYLKFLYLEFYNCNLGLRLTASQDVELAYCKFDDIRGDAAIATLCTGATTWDSTLIHHNDIELLYNNAVPTGKEGSTYVGPDGVQCGTGVSIYNNIIKVTNTEAVYTSTQHPDDIQLNGSYCKVYNNEFINVGDSIFDNDSSYGATTPAHIWIYNNIFRIVDELDPYPEMIRIYKNSTSLVDVAILNNLFIDSNTGGTNAVVHFGNTNTTSSGDITLKNNIFYNCGNGPNYKIIDAPATMADIFDIDNNIYYGGTNPAFVFRGTTYTVAEWISAIDTNGSPSQPLFTSYSYRNSGNEYSLQSNDTIALEQGTTLSDYFTTDINGITRPQGGAWEIGPYEFNPEGEATGAIIPGGCQESEIVSGGKTIVINISGDQFVAAGATFDAQRQNIINGMDSAQAEAAGWDAVVKVEMPVTAVVRTDNDTVTITLTDFDGDPYTAYNITANEIVTVTIPASALVGTVEIVCTPTFQISAGQAGAEVMSIGFSATGGTAVYDVNGISIE